jgi:predicted DNA-binding WGR domain protein
MPADPAGATALGAKLAKRKELKEAFAPLAKTFKYAPRPADGLSAAQAILARALEESDGTPLREAARALATAGIVPGSPWTAIATSPGPKRWTIDLLVDAREPVVYASELGGKVSMWSLETGEHLGDLALPGKKVQTSRLVQLPDGTLRAHVFSHDLRGGPACIAERAPGAKAFQSVVALERTNSYATSDDLAYVVQIHQRIENLSIHSMGGVLLYDVAARSRREVALAFPRERNIQHFVGDTAVLHMENAEGENAVVLVHGPTAIVTELPIDMGGTMRSWSSGAVGLEFWTGGDTPKVMEVDVASRSVVPREATPAATSRKDEVFGAVSLADGRWLDPGRHAHRATLRGADDTSIAAWTCDPYPGKPLIAYDASRDRIIVAGGDPEMPLTVLAPWDRVRAASAPSVPIALSWAKPGAVLRYELADFDVRDEWRFEIVAAGSGLALRIDTGRDRVADAARFSETALANAARPVALAQGGADVDLALEQSDRVPPIVVSRAMHAKIASGKRTPWKSEWSESAHVEATGSGAMRVRVNGAETLVRTLCAAATDDDISLTILDDAEWPLVIERIEGECFVKLVSIDLSNASATKTPAAIVTENAPAGARRFELVDGTSSKFWEVATSGPRLTTRYGKIGTNGQVSTKDLGSPESAARELEKLVREKTKKGYTELR